MAREGRRQEVRKSRTSAPNSWWQKLQRLLLQTAVISGCLGVLAAGAYSAKVLYTLPIEQLVIDGATDNVPAEAIKMWVGPALAGGFFAADLDEIRENLEGRPWVYQATVRRQWPDTVLVSIVEQRPIARWGSHGFLNHEGAYFAGEQSMLAEELPQLDGPDASTVDMMRRYQQVESLLQPVGLQVVSLEQDDIGQIDLVLDNGMGIAFGADHFLQRVQRFIVLWQQHLEGEAVANVDMRYAHGAAVAFQQQTQLALTAVNELSQEEVR